MMTAERLLSLLLQDSPRLLGEAFFYLKEAQTVLKQQGVEALLLPESPLLRFYRCIHAFKGMCGMMASRLPLAAELVPQFHLMEGRLAIKDNWSKAALWLPELEQALIQVQEKIQWAREQREESKARSSSGGLPESVRATSGGRELVFPWESVVQFVPGDQVAGRPFVPVGDRLVAVVPASGKAHEGVTFGIVVRTKSGQEIVVPVQALQIEQVDSVSTAVREAA
jgi:hypothetical protein